MIEQDTIRLLRECDAGVQMGTESIQQVLPWVESGTLKQRLEKCQAEHQKLSGGDPRPAGPLSGRGARSRPPGGQGDVLGQDQSASGGGWQRQPDR